MIQIFRNVKEQKGEGADEEGYQPPAWYRYIQQNRDEEDSK